MSEQLRRGAGRELALRRRAVGLSLTSAGLLWGISLYQAGILKHLPDPPLGRFSSDRVSASGEAYVLFSTPDAPLGVASYALTAALAGWGLRDRAETQPWIPVLAAAKAGFDALVALGLTAEQVSKHKVYCAWCLTITAVTLATVPSVLPEARVAWCTLRARWDVGGAGAPAAG